MLALVKRNPLSRKIPLAEQPRKHTMPRLPNLIPSTPVRTVCIPVKKNRNRDALCRHTSYAIERSTHKKPPMT